jgi:hypothetical protein
MNAKNMKKTLTSKEQDCIADFCCAIARESRRGCEYCKLDKRNLDAMGIYNVSCLIGRTCIPDLVAHYSIKSMLNDLGVEKFDEQHGGHEVNMIMEKLRVTSKVK